ncbi:hypothetical protein Fmac_015470 [Flemingia macrophylla]|uniref:Uncharacterized protein n=1 Tax=Flemingia macrophylla TaxID=520843 RepID=A0ABD1MEN3_9FABA
MAELKLLTTHISDTVLAITALNDVVMCMLLSFAVELANNWIPLVSMWVLLCNTEFVAFMMEAVKPMMKFVAGRYSADTTGSDESYDSDPRGVQHVCVRCIRVWHDGSEGGFRGEVGRENGRLRGGVVVVIVLCFE